MIYAGIAAEEARHVGVVSNNILRQRNLKFGAY
jgi:hypothetical protein